MSFATVLGNYLGARGQARQQSYENSLEQQRLKQESDYNQAELGLQRDEAAQNKMAAQAKMRAGGFDPATGQYSPLAIPKALQQVIPGNKGHAPATNSPEYWSALAAHETQLAQTYRAAGRTDEADSHAANARDAALNATSLANSTFTAGAKTQETLSQSDLARARASAERDLPARAREIARGHDQASLQRAAAQAQAAWNRAELSATTRESVAQYQGTTRYAVAQLAGAYMLTGKNAEDATRAAIADFQQKEMNYRQATRPVSGLDVLPPGYANAQEPTLQSPAVVNNYIGGPGGGLPELQPLQPAPWMKQGNTGIRGGGTKPQQLDASTVLKNAYSHLKAGSSPHAIREALQDYVTRGVLDGATAQQIETQLGIGGSQAPARPPL